MRIACSPGGTPSGAADAPDDPPGKSQCPSLLSCCRPGQHCLGISLCGRAPGYARGQPCRERASERDQGAGREICGHLCQRKAAASGERTADRRHCVGQEISRHEPERHTDSQGTHRCHRKLLSCGVGSGWTAWRGTGIYTCMNRTFRSSTYLQSIHQRHSKTAARKTGGGWICGRLRR